MGRVKADLRVYATADGQYAIVRWVSLVKGDIYAGARFGKPLDADLFRTSYHASGKNHIHIPVHPGRSIGEPGDPPTELTGKRRIASGGGDLSMLDWTTKQPKKDTRTRKSLILDINETPVQRCNPEVWIMEPDKPELVREIHDECSKPGCEVVNMLHADWCNPAIVVIVWKLDDKAQAALEKAIKAQ